MTKENTHRVILATITINFVAVNLMTEPKFHHTVSRFYLEKFSDAKHKHVFYVYLDNGNPYWSRGYPRGLTAIKHYYPKHIEEFFMVIEGRMGSVYDDILKYGLDRNSLEHAVRYFFIQFLRTPKTIRVLHKFAWNKEPIDDFWHQEDDFESTKIKFEEGVAAYIQQFEWGVATVRYPEHEYYLSSDNPVAHHVEESEDRLYISLPLSPKILLFGSLNPQGRIGAIRRGITVPPENFVLTSNILRIEGADKIIIGQEKYKILGEIPKIRKDHIGWFLKNRRLR